MGAIRAYRGLLANRPLSRLMAGEFVSGIGDWLYLVALLVIVYRESEDPLLLGIIGGARIIPYIVLSVVAGIAADRYDRRILIMSTDALRFLCMVGMTALVLVDGPLVGLVGLAILAACFSAFFQPAIGSYMPMLARDERELGPANSLFAALGEVTFIIGPALAGIIIASFDLAVAFAINAGTFVVVFAMFLGLPSGRPGTQPGADYARRQASGADVDGGGAASEAPSAHGETGLTLAPQGMTPGTDVLSVDAAAAAAAAEASGGAGTGPDGGTGSGSLWTVLRPVLRPFSGLVALDLVAGFMFGGISVITVILAVDRLGAGEDATGFLNAAIGVGGVLGAVASGAIVLRANLAPPLLAGAAILGGGFLVLAAVTALPLAAASLAIIAAGALLAGVVGETVFQRVIPDAIRGRALGIWTTASTLTYAAGAFASPILVTRIGFEPVLGIGGAAIILAGMVAVWLIGPELRRPQDATVDTLRRVARLPMFAGVPAPALEAAVGRLVPVTITAGTVVIREGDAPDRFYIIESGAFHVDQLDRGTGMARRLRTMGPDEVFGELGLMHAAPRSATVTASTDGRLLALDGADFLELLSAGQGMGGLLLERYGGAGVAPPA